MKATSITKGNILQMVMSFNILGKLESLLHFQTISAGTRSQQAPVAIQTLNDLIRSGTTRYAYNRRLARYTGPFDYMDMQCDGYCVKYAIHGKHLTLNGVRFALSLSLIKPIYQTYIFPAEVVVDPLQMEIDDELIIFLYLILNLYEKRQAICN